MCAMLVTSLAFVLIPEPASAGTTVDSDIMIDTIWTSSGSPYTITKSVRVLNSKTLTIEEGVTVEFDGLHRLVIEGALRVEGSGSNKVVFTSASPNPRPGDWSCIKFTTGSDASVLDHARFFYAKTAVYAEDASPTITNSMISHAEDAGILAHRSSLQIRTSFIQSANIGIKAINSEPLILNNQLFDNTIGIYLIESNSLIEGNEIMWNVVGIRLDNSGSRIVDNDIASIDDGLIVQNGSDVVIKGNEIEFGQNAGITVIQSEDVELYDNMISQSRVGMKAVDSTLTVSDIRIDMGDFGIQAERSTILIFNSTIDSFPRYRRPLISLESDSHVTLIGSSFDGTVYVDTTSILALKNYLAVRVWMQDGSPLVDAEVEIFDLDDEDDVRIEHTNATGWVWPLLVTDRVYSDSNYSVDNRTVVTVTYEGIEFKDNPREVDMRSPQTEYFWGLETEEDGGFISDSTLLIAAICGLILLFVVVPVVVLVILRPRKRTGTGGEGKGE